MVYAAPSKIRTEFGVKDASFLTLIGLPGMGGSMTGPNNTCCWPECVLETQAIFGRIHVECLGSFPKYTFPSIAPEIGLQRQRSCTGETQWLIYMYVLKNLKRVNEARRGRTNSTYAM